METEKQEKNFYEGINKKNLFIVSIVGVIVATSSLLYVYNHKKRQNETLPPVTAQIEKAFTPKGSIYLSLSSQKEKTMGIYEYNFDKKTLLPYYIPKNGVAFTGTFKASSSELLVAEVLNNKNIQIKQINNQGSSTPITDSAVQTKRHPLYSVPYDAVIFAGKENVSKVLGKPNDFNVYMKRNGEQEKFITQGAMPVLTPDGKSVIVMRSDGLYKVDLVGSSTEHIWKTKNSGTALNQQFSISPKGKYIVWSYPDGEVMYVLEVSSWSPFKANIKYTIKTHAFWPVFSPDEEYIAFEEVAWTNPPSQAKLVVMDLLSLKRNVVQNLDAFIQSSLFINEWK
ncbi:MAG: hypothetical protein KBC41_02125 [Candidatus Pacebacteria bacterium]|nr:hypothetical protein [Candidatus Paceibacterota bacterium]